MTNSEFIDQLLAIPTVSGNERMVNTLMGGYLSFADETDIDEIGNITAVINKGSRPRILLEAHIDEIGYQVTYIDNSGFIYLRACGGIDIIANIGSFVEIINQRSERIPGIIGKKPIHLCKNDERGKAPEIDNIWVDTGLCCEKVRELVSVGDYVSLVSNHRYIGDNMLVGKGLDNKLGVYVVCETIRHLQEEGFKGAELSVLLSTQEELGCKGATAAALANSFDDIISVDVTFTSDVPDVSARLVGDISLGKGPVISLNGDVNRSLTHRIIDSADDIPFQLSANYAASGGTNTRTLQLSNPRARTASISIPLRYMHTPVEMCCVSDVWNTISLIKKFLKTNSK